MSSRYSLDVTRTNHLFYPYLNRKGVSSGRRRRHDRQPDLPCGISVCQCGHRAACVNGTIATHRYEAQAPSPNRRLRPVSHQGCWSKYRIAAPRHRSLQMVTAPWHDVNYSLIPWGVTLCRGLPCWSCRYRDAGCRELCNNGTARWCPADNVEDPILSQGL